VLFKYNGVESVARAGEKVVVPAGVKHTFARSPDSDQDLLINVTLEPAGKGESFFLELVGMFKERKMSPNPALLIWLLCHHDMRLADIPAPVHEFMCVALDLVAPLMGYSLYHNQYKL
jgi:hypothetical protein